MTTAQPPRASGARCPTGLALAVGVFAVAALAAGCTSAPSGAAIGTAAPPSASVSALLTVQRRVPVPGTPRLLVDAPDDEVVATLANPTHDAALVEVNLATGQITASASGVRSPVSMATAGSRVWVSGTYPSGGSMVAGYDLSTLRLQVEWSPPGPVPSLAGAGGLLWAASGNTLTAINPTRQQPAVRTLQITPGVLLLPGVLSEVGKSVAVAASRDGGTLWTAQVTGGGEVTVQSRDPYTGAVTARCPTRLPRRASPA